MKWFFFISIYPSAHEGGSNQIPVGSNTGSLPDLTSVHFPAPALHSSPLDRDIQDHSSSPYSTVSKHDILINSIVLVDMRCGDSVCGIGVVFRVQYLRRPLLYLLLQFLRSDKDIHLITHLVLLLKREAPRLPLTTIPTTTRLRYYDRDWSISLGGLNSKLNCIN